MRFRTAPDSEAHLRIKSVAHRYRTFALVAHLRAVHGMSEVVPERAAGADAPLTKHEIAAAQPMTSRGPCQHPKVTSSYRASVKRRHHSS